MFKTIFILALVAMAGCASADDSACTTKEDCPISGESCFDDSEYNGGSNSCMTISECESACWFDGCKTSSSGNYRCSDTFNKSLKKAAALGMGLIIAIIVGVLVGIGCCIFCCCYFVCASANRNNTQG
jgi:hypothetical protein